MGMQKSCRVENFYEENCFCAWVYSRNNDGDLAPSVKILYESAALQLAEEMIVVKIFRVG